MEIKKNTCKKVCDMGACRKLADYALTFKNLGGAADIDICKDCLTALYKEAKRVIYDKKES